MQLGIRLHDTKELRFEDRIVEVAKNGFTCGQLALGKVFSDLNVEDGALTPGLAMHLKRVFEQNKVDCAVLGCYLNLGNPNKEQLVKDIHRYMAHIRFASILGAGVVGTETGAPNEEYEPCPECFTEEALEYVIENLRVIVEYAEKMGVIVAIEPVATHIVNTPQRARKVLDIIDSPNLQIIFDPVNLLCIDNYENRKEIISQAIELLGEDIAIVHMKDFIITEDGMFQNTGAGLGMMEYDQVLEFIQSKKPYIHCTLEDTVPDNALFCKNYIETQAKECGKSE